MTETEEWFTLKKHFEDARSLSDDQFQKYLDVHCAGDQAMRRTLISLINSHRESKTSSPSLNLNELMLGSVGKPLFEMGDRVGQYEICELINTGGMGEVYLARRTAHYESTLAIKIIRTGIATPAMIERFRQERQTLAKLNHPSITKIIDGGTTSDGLPYIVMEYVHGSSIAKFCRESQQSTRAVIELFMSACEAVQHAHQHLIIHRDIKQGNILVTDKGEVKLLDFGIAGDTSCVEGCAGIPDGPMTLVSSSPEQIRADPVGMTTDVYSLGVVLYELVAGVAPYQLDNLSREQVREKICHHYPPPPSSHLGRSGGNGLRNELDAIVQKAMHKHPSERYQSVEQLIDDLRRCVSHHPVDACSTSVIYRSKKLIDRNRFATILTILIVALAGFACVSTAVGFQQTRAAYAESKRQRDDARDTVKFLQTVLAQANPYVHDEPMLVIDALHQADSLINSELFDRPMIAARVRMAIGQIYMDLFMYDRAEPYLAESLMNFTTLDSHIDIETITDCTSLLARARSDLVWTREVDCNQVVQMQSDVLAARRDSTRSPNHKIACALGDLALAHWAQDSQRPASDLVVELYTDSLNMFDELGIRKSSAAAENDVGLGHAYASRGQNELAEHHFRYAMRSYEQIPQQVSPFYFQAANACSQLLLRTGHPENANELFSIAIGRSPNFRVLPAELEARWGRLLCTLILSPEANQNRHLLEVLHRQVLMYLQDSPNDPQILELHTMIIDAEASDAPAAFRQMWPVMLLHQQGLPKSLHTEVLRTTTIGLRMYGRQWMLESIDLAIQSDRLTSHTTEILAYIRNQIAENAVIPE